MAWKIDTLLSGPDRELLPPSPADDPAYWEMISIVHEAWQQTTGAALDGVAHLDFEAHFVTQAAKNMRAADLSEGARQAAGREIERRLSDRRAVLSNVRLFEERSPDRGHLRQVAMRWRHVDAGMIQYEICPEREHGWIAKITIDSDYLRGGLGRRGLAYLTARYSKANWTTSTQMSGARGFWATMQDQQAGGWTPRQGACTHGWDPLHPPHR